MSVQADRPQAWIRLASVGAVVLLLLVVRIVLSPVLTPLLLLPIVFAALWFGSLGGALVGAVSLLALGVCDELRILHADHRSLGADCAGLVLYGAAGFLIGRILGRRQRDSEEQRRRLLASEQEARAAAELEQLRSRRLAEEALRTEQKVRKRISENLHDDAIQSLLAAAQDITEASVNDPTSLARAASAVHQATTRLREAVLELHPVALEHGGLEPALKALAQQQAERGRFQPRVRVAPDASGKHDLLMLTLARELLTNVVKHADAHEVLVDVARTASHVVLLVRDDGRGMHAERRRIALRDGHIGLVSCAERAALSGGDFDVISAPGEGTMVRVLLPIDQPEPPAQAREAVAASERVVSGASLGIRTDAAA